MILTEDQRKTFEAASEPLIKWLCDECNPHVSVHVTPTSAELSENTAGHHTDKFLKD